MRYKLKSKELKRIESIIKTGVWHKTFAFAPHAVDSAKGYTIFAWLRPVMRRKIRTFNDPNFKVKRVEYAEAENITMQSLIEPLDIS